LKAPSDSNFDTRANFPYSKGWQWYSVGESQLQHAKTYEACSVVQLAQAMNTDNPSKPKIDFEKSHLTPILD